MDNKANKYMTTTTASTADFNKKTIGGADLYTSKMINDGVQVRKINFAGGRGESSQGVYSAWDPLLNVVMNLIIFKVL